MLGRLNESEVEIRKVRVRGKLQRLFSERVNPQQRSLTSMTIEKC
jgi:hypothetical protein